jgi:sulfane dehydrogenase subunit SoxC
MTKPIAVGRRTIIAGLGAAVAGLSGRRAAAAPEGPASLVPPSMTTQGAGVDEHPYGVPSRFESGVVRKVRVPPPFPTAAYSLTPWQDLHGIVTPNGLHYERHHGGVPDIDPATHRLMIHGLVERPLVLTMDEILRMPSVSRIHFLECSGNSQGWTGEAPASSVQDTHGLMSCCEWTGVLVSTLLKEVGLKADATWMLAEGTDAAGMTRSIPVAKAMDDAILAYAQNGERLRPEQGYPLRLFLPGFEGNMSVKWLRRLKLGDAPFQTREETSKYTELMPDGTAWHFTFVMDAKSVITAPSGTQIVRSQGFHEISGIAWSGRGRITRVEVSTDGGTTWQDAILQDPVLTKCVTRFRLPWRWQGEETVLMSRATDETGYVQPTRADLVAARGTHSYYHFNAIQPWRVAPDGVVTNAI